MMDKTILNGSFKWIATALVSVLVLVGGLQYRANTATKTAQWQRMHDQDVKIDDNSQLVGQIGVRINADDRRVTESINRIEVRQEKMDGKLDKIIERLPHS